MRNTRSRLALAGRRGTVLGAAFALLAGVVAAPAAQAQDHAPGTISDASFSWGVSGYAQKGIFGAWRFIDASGDASVLRGSVSGGGQTEYTPAPFPATSLPDLAGKTPNAVTFADGEGVRAADGTVTIDWDGEFTFNAYPAMYNAPDEKLSDPTLTVRADGSGSLAMDVVIGAGVDLEGNPTTETNAGRKTVVSFGAGGATVAADGTVTLTPEYAGVEYTNVGDAAQSRTCAAPSVWGSWPADFVSAISPSVRPHYYSTGCGGLNDAKAPLPLQVRYDVTEDQPQAPVGTPKLEVSDTTLAADGSHQVTITGTGFSDPSVLGTRPPLAGKGAGVYVVFGRFADQWRPSTGAASSTRTVVEQKWAVAAADMATIGGAQGGAVELKPDGSFSLTLTVSKEAADAESTTGTYGIYTYPGSGATHAAWEKSQAITFTAGDGEGEDDDEVDPGTGGTGSLGTFTSSLASIFGS